MRMEDLIDAIKKHGDLDDETIIDAGSNGADSGWGGFTYTGDCEEFYEENKALIWEMLQIGAEEFGCKSAVEFVGQFRRADMADDESGFKNLCAWYALEEGGRWLADNIERLKEEATDEFRDDYEMFKEDAKQDARRKELTGWTGGAARSYVEETERYSVKENRPCDFDRVNWDEIAEEWEDDYEEEEEEEDED